MLFRARRVQESPFGCLDSDGGFKIAFPCVRVAPKLQTNTKMKQKRWTKTSNIIRSISKDPCSHDSVDPSANTFARVTSGIQAAFQDSKAISLGHRVTRKVYIYIYIYIY